MSAKERLTTQIGKQPDSCRLGSARKSLSRLPGEDVLVVFDEADAIVKDPLKMGSLEPA